MGKRTTGDLKDLMANPPPREEADAVQREIEVLAKRTEDLLAELEQRIESKVDYAKQRVEQVKQSLQRVRALGDVPGQHPRATAGVGLSLVVLAGAGIWWLAWRRAERKRLVHRIQRRAGAYRALLADPERALAPRGPSVQRKVLTALAVTLVTSVAKRLLAK